MAMRQRRENWRRLNVVIPEKAGKESERNNGMEERESISRTECDN
jgi:hypothetical protein